jgi:DNA repair exonuclease SbcCD nuclease subunit
VGVIIYAADLHLDCRNPDTRCPGSRALIRENEAGNMLRELYGMACAQTAGAVVIAGDIADRRTPRPWAYKAFGSFLRACSKSCIEVHAIRGNHDGDETGGREFCDAFSGENGFTYHTSPGAAEIAGTPMLMLPWTGRAATAAKAGRSMSVADQHAYMRDAFSHIIEANPGADVIVTHFTVAGARFSTDSQPLLGDSSEFMLPQGLFSAPGLRYAVAGHIHKQQVIDGPVPVYIPGSAILCGFGQEAEAPGVLIDPGYGMPYLEILPYDHLRFVTVPVSGPVPDVAGAAARIGGVIPSGSEGTRVVRALEAEIAAAGAVYIGRHITTREKHETRAAAHTITGKLTPDAALSEYMTLAGGEYAERRGRLMLAHSDIQKGVENASR